MDLSHFLNLLTPAQKRAGCLLLTVLLLLLSPHDSGAQDIPTNTSTPPAIDLLKLNGSKPNLSRAGEGITSIKTTLLFERGVTEVKPFDLKIKIELPVGYSLFNKLAYIIDSKAVYSGYSDVTFKIPSAKTRAAFETLRLLYAEYDNSDPLKPRWVDATLLASSIGQVQPYLGKDDLDKRLPDFQSRTLHAFMEQRPRVLVVALKDAALVRENFRADLLVAGTAPEQIMQGRRVVYDLKVTNLGPDTATDVRVQAAITFSFISVSSSVDKCHPDAGTLYCKFAKIDKGETVAIKIVEKEEWRQYLPDPSERPVMFKLVGVYALEADPAHDNNRVELSTQIVSDPNEPPVGELIAPQANASFVGPSTDVRVVAKASDPDGVVLKVNFYDWEKPVGEGTRINGDEFEMVYANVNFGRHQLWAKVTDNLGRDVRIEPLEFFVNGLASVYVTSPNPGHVQDRSNPELSVIIHASHPELKVKEVFVDVSPPGELDSRGHHRAVRLDSDNFAAKLPLNCERDCQVWSTAIDEAGVETRSEPIYFTVTEAPEVKLYQYDGETFFQLSPGNDTFDSTRGSTLAAEAKHLSHRDGRIVKMDFFVNEKPVCTYVTTDFESYPYPTMPCSLRDFAAGTYKVQVVATDSDGSIGKSSLVEIEIKKN
jgi:uncharacterized repeat protein (TIGR01451 family)